MVMVFHLTKSKHLCYMTRVFLNIKNTGTWIVKFYLKQIPQHHAVGEIKMPRGESFLKLTHSNEKEG